MTTQDVIFQLKVIIQVARELDLEMNPEVEPQFRI